MVPHPNLLYIMTDQQRFDAIGARGNDRIITPNLDRLASQSTLFEHSYCTQPVCSPARSSLMTGTWPHANGVTQLNEQLHPGIPRWGRTGLRRRLRESLLRPLGRAGGGPVIPWFRCVGTLRLGAGGATARRGPPAAERRALCQARPAPPARTPDRRRLSRRPGL